MSVFGYDPAVIEQYPAIRAGVILALGVRNGPTPPELAAAFVAEQQATLARIGDTPLSDLPTLAAWRRAFSAFGIKPTQYRSAAEALLRRLTKKGDIPSLNLLVDMANMVSIRYALPVAAFDLCETQGAVSVSFAQGNERFTPLGEAGVEHPEPGEVVFVDEAGLVSARRWCWRQSEQSAARDTTTNVLITVEGLHDDAERDINAAHNDLLALLSRYAGGSLQSELLSPARPVFAPGADSV